MGRIVFGDRPRSQAAFTREGDNLTVTFAGAADAVSVLGFFSGGATRLEFADAQPVWPIRVRSRRGVAAVEKSITGTYRPVHMNPV